MLEPIISYANSFQAKTLLKEDPPLSCRNGHLRRGNNLGCPDIERTRSACARFTHDNLCGWRRQIVKVTMKHSLGQESDRRLERRFEERRRFIRDTRTVERSVSTRMSL